MLPLPNGNLAAMIAGYDIVVFLTDADRGDRFGCLLLEAYPRERWPSPHTHGAVPASSDEVLAVVAKGEGRNSINRGIGCTDHRSWADRDRATVSIGGVHVSQCSVCSLGRICTPSAKSEFRTGLRTCARAGFRFSCKRSRQRFLGLLRCVVSSSYCDCQQCK